MNLFDYHVAYREALSAYEGLRKLGFLPDDIYFSVGGYVPAGVTDANDHSGPGWQVLVVLLAQDKCFNIVVGLVDDEPDRIERTWTELATAVRSGKVNSASLDEIWHASIVHNRGADLVVSLINKGFVLPRAAQKLLN